MAKPKYTSEKDMRILVQVKKDLIERKYVGSQTSYAISLLGNKELNLKSFSQSSISRRFTHWKINVNTDGYLEYYADHETIVYSDRLYDLLQKTKAKYYIISNSIIFLKISRDFSYTSMDLMLKLHPNRILSVLRDELGNLIIFTYNKESQKPIISLFKEMDLEELIYIPNPPQGNFPV